MVIFFILKFFLFCLTDAVVNAIWKELISLVKSVIESGKHYNTDQMIFIALSKLAFIYKIYFTIIFEVSQLSDFTFKQNTVELH